MKNQYEIHWTDEVNDSVMCCLSSLEEAKSYCDAEVAGMEKSTKRDDYDSAKQCRYYVLDLATFDEEAGADEVYSTEWYWAD